MPSISEYKPGISKGVLVSMSADSFSSPDRLSTGFSAIKNRKTLPNIKRHKKITTATDLAKQIKVP